MSFLKTSQLPASTKLLLGIQHVLAMFGATVLVPFLTGLNPSLALLAAGGGTLIFHFCTNRQVPVFLGSSFAFIGAISMVLQNEGLGSVKTGIIFAGIIYLILALIVKLIGVERVKSFFPPVVVGPIIMVIGLRLAPIALKMAGYSPETSSFDLKSLIVAGVVVSCMIFLSILKKSFFRLIPILLSVVMGYIVAYFLGMVDLSVVKEASWFGLNTSAMKDLTTLPVLSWSAILAIAPIAIVTFVEHLGDITTNGAVVGKNFIEKPGIHRTLMGDGLATIFAGFIGGPTNTTYGENTGVLAITKVYDPVILRIAAVFATIMGLIGKLGAIIQSIPVAVMGGVSFILFGMIAAVGIRTLVEGKPDFSKSRNLIITSLILVLGLAIQNVQIENFTLSGLVIATIVGITLNQILPKEV